MVPFELELRQCAEAFGDIFIQGLSLLVQNFSEDVAAWIQIELVLHSKDNKSASPFIK